MSWQWYVAREGRKDGPFPFEQLQEWARVGSLLRGEMVLSPHSTKWQTAASVEGMFEVPVAAIPVAAIAPSSATGFSPQMQRAVVVGLALGGFLAVVMCGGFIALVSKLSKPADQVVQVEQTAPNRGLKPKGFPKESPATSPVHNLPKDSPTKSPQDLPKDAPKNAPQQDGGSTPKLLEIAHSKVRGIAFSPNGALLATDDEDGITVWNAKNGEQIRRIQVELSRSTELFYPFGRKGLGNGLAFSADGKRLFAERSVQAVNSGKQLIPEYVWTLDVESGKTLSTKKITDGTTVCVPCPFVYGRFALLPLLAAGGGSVVVYDMENGQKVFQTDADKVPGFDVVDLWTKYCVSRDGKLFFSTGSALGKIGRLMSIDRNQTLRTIEWPEDVTVQHCLFGPDGGSIIVLCDVQKKAHVRVFATANNRMTAEYKLSEKELGVAPQVAVSRNGRWLYVGAGCGETLLDLEKRSSVPVPMPSGKKHRWRPTFSPDSRRLAVLIEDKVVIVPVEGKKE